MAADHDAAPSTGSGLRFDRLDALRGLAIVWMVAFHFSFDLNHLGFWTPRQNFYADPFWTWQRTAIVSLFLFCAGLSQAVALAAGQPWGRFWRRWAQVAGCALLVSAGSALMFPHSWISFGVLHGMAVMLILARLAAPLRGGCSPATCMSQRTTLASKAMPACPVCSVQPGPSACRAHSLAVRRAGGGAARCATAGGATRGPPSGSRGSSAAGRPR
jgi:peptidoglycan/LPS O-acetylase OafA/YrhL